MVRFAEGPTVEVTSRIDAPPSRVWALVTDISVPSRFSGELQAAEWVDGASGPVVGARFRGRNAHPRAGQWETTSTVVAVEPERLLEWRVGDPDAPMASWGFELAADGGGTSLRQWARMGPGPSALTEAIAARPDKEERIIERRLAEHRANMEATVAGVKAMAEAVDGSDRT